MASEATGADSAVDESTRTAEKSVEWIDRNMSTHFANVVNVQSTREQVDLFFGTNQTWNLTADPRLAVELAAVERAPAV